MSPTLSTNSIQSKCPSHLLPNMLLLRKTLIHQICRITVTTLFVFTSKYYAFTEPTNISSIQLFLPLLLAEMLCLEHCQSEQKRLELSHSSNFNKPKPSFRTNAALETLGYNFQEKRCKLSGFFPNRIRVIEKEPLQQFVDRLRHSVPILK